MIRIMGGARTPKAKSLARARRQFFQWYYTEAMPLLVVTQRFERLSEDLEREGIQGFRATYGDSPPEGSRDN